MKYDLVLDCGGTKVCAILYDEEFRPVRTCRVGSVRTTSLPPEFIRKNTQELIDRMELRGMELGTVCGVGAGGLVKAIQEVCQVEQVRHYGELEVGLAAAGLHEGYMAVCGTGATLGCICDKGRYSVGGYGAIVYDAGSGYWLAREAFAAAIADSELRGAHTMLTDLIARKFGGTRETFRRAVFALYSVKDTPPITAMTACAPLVAEAAKAGDPVAYDILVRAGKVLAEQTNALRLLHDLPESLPATVSGGVWKGHPVIFQEYCRVLRENGMTGSFCLPEFEPIVGAILLEYRKKYPQIREEEHLRLRELYQDYLFA